MLLEHTLLDILARIGNNVPEPTAMSQGKNANGINVVLSEPWTSISLSSSRIRSWPCLGLQIGICA